MILKLAFLGAVKHWRRSGVVAGAVAVACAVMIAVGSLLNGVTASFYDSVIPNSGHVRIDDSRAQNALNPFDLSLLIREAGSKVARIESLGDRRIVDVEPIVSFGAMIVEDTGTGDPRNLAMRGMGMDADTRFADNVRDAIVAGEFLPGGEGIAISEAAARLVGTGIGQSVLVLVQDASSQPWYKQFVVTGVFRTENLDFDETTFFMSREKSAEMLDVADSAREIRILLSDRGDAKAVATEVSSALAGGGSLRVLPWQTINASIFAILLFIKILMGIIMALFAIVAGTIIANTSLMSVMERLGEFGTMRAIGLRARTLQKLILVEGALLGAAGVTLGIVVGSVVVAELSREGLDLGGIMESMGLKRYNRPSVSWLWYAACAAASLLVTLAATARAAESVKSKSVAESITTAV